MTTIGTFQASEDHERADDESVDEPWQWSICQRLSKLIYTVAEPQLVNMAVNTTLLIHLVEMKPRQCNLLRN